MVEAPDVIKAVEQAGVSLAKVTDELEQEGVKKFADSYQTVLARIEEKAGLLTSTR